MTEPNPNASVPVKMAASGIVSALGTGKADNLQGLLGGTGKRPDRLSLPHFEEPVEVPYYGVRGAPEQPEERLHWLLDQAMDELLAEHPLTEAQRAEIPVFIGSSCWGIAIAEDLYRQQYRENPETAIPLPLDGFSQISRHLQHRWGFHGADFALNTACGCAPTASCARLIGCVMAWYWGKDAVPCCCPGVRPVSQARWCGVGRAIATPSAFPPPIRTAVPLPP